MVRFSAIFVTTCMALIALSLGVVVLSSVRPHRCRRRRWWRSRCLMALVVYTTLAVRLRERANSREQIFELARNSGDMTRQLAEFGRRLSAMDNRVEREFERSADKRSAARLRAGRTLVASEGTRGLWSRRTTPRSASLRQPSRAVCGAAADPADAAVGGGRSGSVRRFAPSARSRLSAGSTAKASSHWSAEPSTPTGSISICSRLSRCLSAMCAIYEAMSRLKAESGEVIAAGDFIKYAEAGLLMPKLDHMTVMRCVQVVRRLLHQDPRHRAVLQSLQPNADRSGIPAAARIPRGQPRYRSLTGVRIYPERGPRHGAARAREPCRACRARFPLLHGQRRRSATRWARIARTRLPLHQSAGDARCSSATAPPRPTSLRPIYSGTARQLRRRSGRRTYRERKHRGQSARVRRAFWARKFCSLRRGRCAPKRCKSETAKRPRTGEGSRQRSQSKSAAAPDSVSAAAEQPKSSVDLLAAAANDSLGTSRNQAARPGGRR